MSQSLPGISPSVGGFRNDIIIRGGGPNETVYYIDGIEIPNINHFSTQGSSGGPVGLVNISFIKDVTLSTSSFGAEYDNALSGVLSFVQKEANKEKIAGNFRVGSSEAGITLNTPLFLKQKRSCRFLAGSLPVPAGFLPAFRQQLASNQVGGICGPFLFLLEP